MSATCPSPYKLVPNQRDVPNLVRFARLTRKYTPACVLIGRAVGSRHEVDLSLDITSSDGVVDAGGVVDTTVTGESDIEDSKIGNSRH
jgi:hypothetical protein